MNENRGFPRFIPRGGARVSITIGESITPLIAPLVETWRANLPRASSSPSSASAPTAETKEESDADALRAHQVHHADYLSGAFDPDEATRREITSLLQEQVRALGEQVEEEEGRFARGTWGQSRRRESVQAGPGGLPPPQGPLEG